MANGTNIQHTVAISLNPSVGASSASLVPALQAAVDILFEGSADLQAVVVVSTQTRVSTAHTTTLAPRPDTGLQAGGLWGHEDDGDGGARPCPVR